MTLSEMQEKKSELGLSCDWIAARSGVPLSTVHKIFGGVTAHPRLSTLNLLSRVFDETLPTASDHTVPDTGRLILGEIYSSLRAFILDQDIPHIPYFGIHDVRILPMDKNKLPVQTPLFIGEVISHQARWSDMTAKLANYKKNGVKEYWIIDPTDRLVVVHVLKKGNRTDIHTWDEPVPVSVYESRMTIDFSIMPAYTRDHA